MQYFVEMFVFPDVFYRKSADGRHFAIITWFNYEDSKGSCFLDPLSIGLRWVWYFAQAPVNTQIVFLNVASNVLVFTNSLYLLSWSILHRGVAKRRVPWNTQYWTQPHLGFSRLNCMLPKPAE